MKTRHAFVECNNDSPKPEWFVTFKDGKNRVIFTAGYATKRGAQKAAAELNKATWLVAA